jgi:hypothetical protein
MSLADLTKQRRQRMEDKKDNGLTPEEGERIQAELFAQSKAKMESPDDFDMLDSAGDSAPAPVFFPVEDIQAPVPTAVKNDRLESPELKEDVEMDDDVIDLCDDVVVVTQPAKDDVIDLTMSPPRNGGVKRKAVGGTEREKKRHVISMAPVQVVEIEAPTVEDVAPVQVASPVEEHLGLLADMFDGMFLYLLTILDDE